MLGEGEVMGLVCNSTKVYSFTLLNGISDYREITDSMH